MADHVLEGRPVEQRRGQDVHRVEPAARLVDVLDDEVGGEVVLEPLLVLERVVELGERHRPRLEPAVEYLGHPPHRRLPSRVVGVGTGQVVDERAVQVVGSHAEVGLDLVEAAVDVDPGVFGVVAAPHRDRRTPEAVAADRPVAGAVQPHAEAAVADVARYPVDACVDGEHPVPDVGDLHEPGRDGLVDDGRVGAPAVRVVVLVGVVADDPAGLLEVSDDVGVGLEHVGASPVGDLVGEAAMVVDGDHPADRDAVGLAGDLVVLAEARGHVDGAGALGGVDEAGAEHPEGVGAVGEVREQRREGAAHEVGTGQGADGLGALELDGVALDGFGAQHMDGAVGVAVHRVGDVGADRQGQVRRQGPRRRRPGQQPQRAWVAVGRLEVERHGDGRVLAGPGGVVEADLEVGQRRLGAPRVGHDPERLVDEAPVPELFERPHDRLHVVAVHGLVVVFEVDPAGLSGDRLLPLARVAHHRRATVLVEGLDPVLDDVGAARDRQLALDLHLGGQAVAVPAEATGDLVAPHRLVAGDDILDVAGQEVSVVGQAVGEWRPVVERELDFVGAVVYRGGKGALGRPALESPLLDGGEVGLADVGVRLFSVHDRKQANGASGSGRGRVGAASLRRGAASCRRCCRRGCGRRRRRGRRPRGC